MSSPSPEPIAEWLRPSRLVPDLLLGGFVALVAVQYLGAQLLGQLAAWLSG